MKEIFRAATLFSVLLGGLLLTASCRTVPTEDSSAFVTLTDAVPGKFITVS